MVVGFVVGALLLAAAGGLAQEGTAPAGSGATPAPTPGAPVNADIETLRKLLGVSAPVPVPAPVEAPAAPEPPPAPAPPPVAEPAPVPAAEVPAEAVVAPSPSPEPEPVKAEAPAKPSKSSKTPAPRQAPVKAKKPAPAPVRRAEPVKIKASPTPVPSPASEAAEEAASEPKAPVSPPAPAAPPGEDLPAAGTVLSASNLPRWQHLLGPGQQWALARGATMRVVDRRPIPTEPKRVLATERYSSQVQLAPDKRRLLNYVAGAPFPIVNPEDPDAGTKLMFNYEARVSIDDVDVRNWGCQTGSISPQTGFRVERDFRNGHFRRLAYVGRLYHQPMPTWNNGDGVRSREMLHPITEPFDLKGAGFTYNRYLDPDRPDDSWLYFPQVKRVRRLSTAQRSEGVFGQDIDLDSYAGFSGSPAWSEWRLLGIKTVMATMHAESLPAKWLPAPADFLFDDVWEPRLMYVIEGRSRLPGYAFSRRIIYLDRESFLVPINEIYDLKGNLWKSELLAWKFATKPKPNAVRAVYDTELGFIPGFVLFDMQFNHATHCELPAPDAPKDEEGWFYNFGDAEGTTEEVFSVSSFIDAGR